MAISSQRKVRMRRFLGAIDTRRLDPPVVSGLLDITYEQTQGAPRR